MVVVMVVMVLLVLLVVVVVVALKMSVANKIEHFELDSYERNFYLRICHVFTAINTFSFFHFKQIVVVVVSFVFHLVSPPFQLFFSCFLLQPV